MQPTPILRALDIARWAPSGDNSQSWRFTITSELSATISVKRDRENMYEFNRGVPVMLSIGILLETLRIGASAEGYSIAWDYTGFEDDHFKLAVKLIHDQTPTDPLLPYVTTRSVNRKAMKMTPLTSVEKEAMAASLGTDMRVVWHEGRKEKWASTKLIMLATDLRLRMKASFLVLTRVLEWDCLTSETRMPVATVPTSPLTRHIMRWCFVAWPRMRFMATYMGGTIVPILETDLIPCIRSAAHLTLEAAEQPNNPVAFINHGMRLQRFWLTATSLGLTIQPLYSHLMLSYYGEHEPESLETDCIRRKVIRLARKVRNYMEPRGIEPNKVIFIARIGHPYPQKLLVRSLRMPLEKLIEADISGTQPVVVASSSIRNAG